MAGGALCRERAPPASLLPPQWSGAPQPQGNCSLTPPSPAAFSGLWAGLLSTPLCPSHPFPRPPPTRFMEFEAEEEMQIHQWQWTQGVQGLAPPAPAKPDPWVPPAPVVGPQPGTAPCSLRSPWQRLQGLRAGHCPHRDLFLSRGRCLSIRTAMGAEVSAALCHHRVWTWLRFIISHLPVKGPNVKSAEERAGWGPFGESVAPRFLPCDPLRCSPPTSALPRLQGVGWS